ncbi:hypothetical protein TSA6c_02295 [Azospirillum sp. TSA6c]|nr:hypothetical protein TSA6c_02295 [Azospirillum sp. TSA6c]
MIVTQLVATVLKVEPSSVTSETSMKTTPEWDSLRHMELILAIEDRFGLILDGDEIACMTTVGSIHDVLRLKGVMQ